MFPEAKVTEIYCMANDFLQKKVPMKFQQGSS